ncbi:MAG TPA: AAA family ATPase [Chthonomonadaceae bacterium]|nr:AAA family ATPase [Chthonomonadaceae bacterium]
MTPLWRICLFGRLRVEREGEEVLHFRTQKTGALLAYLAYFRDRAHPREELIDQFWQEADLDSGRASLRTALAALRRLLEPSGVAADSVLIADRVAIRLDPEAVTTDVSEFEAALRAAQSAITSEERARLLAQSLELYRGPLLSAFQEPWVVRERQRLEQVCQRARRDLESLPRLEDAPPAEETPARSPRLPLQLTRFFGREAEMARLELLFRDRQARLVTLTGPGGSGKTRLAIEVARNLNDAFDGALWFVPLADIADPRLIAGAILKAMGQTQAASDPLDQVVAALPRKPALLILDNFEQLVEEGASVVWALLARVPSLICLVTSRQRLDLGGERDVPILPLPVPSATETPQQLDASPSVRLLVDRAQAVRPDFQVTAQNAGTVAALCGRLEGIPLAIELAAAWTNLLTLPQMLARLEHRFDLLASRRKDLMARHQTLRATIEWSYRLLPAELQGFFARLCVFHGGWTLEAAEQVTGYRAQGTGGRPEGTEGGEGFSQGRETLSPVTSMDTLEAIEQLRERSLLLAVESGAEMRYRMLETLREYAAEQLTTEERTALQERLARWCRVLAEEGNRGLAGPEHAFWLRRLEAEHDNFRASLTWALEADGDLALRLAAALARFWEVRGYVREGSEWLERALAVISAPTLARAIALDQAGYFAWYLRDFGRARGRLEASLALYRQAEDAGIASPLNHLGGLLLFENRPEEARPLLEEALAATEASGDRRTKVGVLENLTRVAVVGADFPAVERYGAQWLEEARSVGDRSAMVGALTMWGIGLISTGERERARRNFTEALEIAGEVGETFWSSGALWGLGNLAILEGAYAQANAYLARCMARLGTTGFDVVKHFVLEAKAYLFAAEGQMPRAARLLGATEHFKATGQSISAPILHTVFDSFVQKARAALGEEAFAAEKAAGARLSWEDAISLAFPEEDTIL